MKLLGIILIIIGIVAFIPIQMILPFPYGLALGLLLFILGIIVVIVSLKGRQKRTPSLEILKERYAKGEITKEEFDKMKEDLS